MAASLDYFLAAQNRLTIAKAEGNTAGIVFELDRLHANIHFATKTCLKESGIGEEVRKLVKHSAAAVSGRSSSLVERWTRALGIKPRARTEVASPLKLKRGSAADIEGSTEPVSKRLRRAENVGDLSHQVREIPTSKLNAQIPCPSTPEFVDEPLIDAIMSACGSQMKTVRVTIAARDTLDKRGEVPLKIVLVRNGDDPIWKVVLEWSERHLKLPTKRLPNDPQKLIEKGVTVCDARGWEYDLTKNLTEAYEGRVCVVCHAAINGVIHIQDNGPCHFGCSDDCQPSCRLETRLGLHMHIQWPARALPKDWGKKPTSRPAQSKQCEVCGEDKVFKTMTSDDGEIKTQVFCQYC